MTWRDSPGALLLVWGSRGRRFKPGQPDEGDPLHFSGSQCVNATRRRLEGRFPPSIGCGGRLSSG